MATKLSLYNDALLLLGQRRLSSDTEDRMPRYYLDDQYNEGAIDYCLEVVQPAYARKHSAITAIAPPADTTYTGRFNLPSDFNSLVEVFSDGKFEDEVSRFVRESTYLLADFSTLYIRYVQDFTTTGLTNMPASFARVVAAYLARELSIKIDPDVYDDLDALFKLRVQQAKEIDGLNEPGDRALVPSTLTNAWRRIYNDALLILGQEPIATNNDDSARKSKLDIALDADLVESVLEDTSWHFGYETKQIFSDTDVTPAFGYQHAHELPVDMHRLDGVYADELMETPIRKYQQEGGYIFTTYDTIYIQFVSKDYLTTPDSWPSYFKRLVAARMAIDGGASIPGANLQNAGVQYEMRRDEALSTDAIQSPPKVLSQGSWSASRRPTYSRRRDRP